MKTFTCKTEADRDKLVAYARDLMRQGKAIWGVTYCAATLVVEIRGMHGLVQDCVRYSGAAIDYRKPWER